MTSVSIPARPATQARKPSRTAAGNAIIGAGRTTKKRNYARSHVAKHRIVRHPLPNTPREETST